MAPASVYIYSLCVSKCGGRKYIVPTRLMASNTNLNGTTVCAYRNEATRQKGRNQKAFYSLLLKLNTARLKTEESPP